MTQGKKIDNFDEIITIERERQRAAEAVEDNMKQQENIREMQDLTQQIYRDQSDIMDELNYYWKGDRAGQFVNRSYEDAQLDQQIMMDGFSDIQESLEGEKKALCSQEEQLEHRIFRLKNEDIVEDVTWD